MGWFAASALGPGKSPPSVRFFLVVCLAGTLVGCGRLTLFGPFVLRAVGITALNVSGLTDRRNRNPKHVHTFHAVLHFFVPSLEDDFRYISIWHSMHASHE